MKLRLYIVLLLAMALLPACKDDDTMGLNDVPRTYRMRLDVSLSNYDAVSTRAAGYSFINKDQVYVLFHQGSETIFGTAVYEIATGLWTITPSQSLKETRNGHCQLAFFIDAGNATETAVSLTPHTRIYTDGEATYSLGDNLLTVQGLLTPALGRIRFHGSSGQSCSVVGLSSASTFNLKNHTYSLSAYKISATCASDGYTPYYYMAFADADKRQLTFEMGDGIGLRRSFSADVLQAGISGYVDIPSLNSHVGWTLTNLTTGEEIVLVSLSKPSATNIGMTHATLAAQVTSAGGGHLSATGFVIATTPNPTTTDRRIDCGTATSLSSQVTGLSASTTYYIRAFAVNEAGTAYSEEFSFTTKDEPDGTQIDLDDYPDDSSWDGK